jgi:hypothetical protein
MPSGLAICLACGAEMAPALQLAASMRCHECRAAGAPLKRSLVDGVAGRPVLMLVPPLPPQSPQRPLAA